MRATELHKEAFEAFSAGDYDEFGRTICLADETKAFAKELDIEARNYCRELNNFDRYI